MNKLDQDFLLAVDAVYVDHYDQALLSNEWRNAYNTIFNWAQCNRDLAVKLLQTEDFYLAWIIIRQALHEPNKRR